ncbi:hypothetical protein FIBSPDRAFT_806710 [Athelia psychrophila]|uniref:Aminoglycoside phosphotransferase domain-containing protein n=1 Tax=Athelia psychrophila TaxID=1759441 RepID=A0A167V083_9AGAM|nr:hypothetical protein FIBSPDRAFT_806710 [Fibularhizoctonia sp. CBS 109695]
MLSGIDLSTTSGVLTYLESTLFASDRVEPLSGGLGNFVYRVHLRGHATLKTAVVKYAAPYLASNVAFPFSVERMAFEVKAMRAVKAALPIDLVISVPTVHHWDEVAHVMIMDDCGEDSRSLKQLMLEQPPPVALAHTIGAALGEFLGRMHAWGVDSTASQHAYFDTNQQGKMITRYVTYDRLVSTLNGQDHLPALSDPPLNVAQAKLDVISKVSDERRDAINRCQDTLTMGDFWPGNIVVNLQYPPSGDPPILKRIYVVDWELAKPGLAGLDVGQLCAEMHLLRRFSPASEPAVSAAMNAFLETYREKYTVSASMATVVAGHIGAHVVALAPRTPWGGKDLTREVVMEGVEYLVEAYAGDNEWLQSSIVRPLL